MGSFLRDLISQNMTELSSEPDTAQVDSSLNLTQVTLLAWTLIRRWGTPVLTSQMMTDLSAPHETIWLLQRNGCYHTTNLISKNYWADPELNATCCHMIHRHRRLHFHVLHRSSKPRDDMGSTKLAFYLLHMRYNMIHPLKQVKFVRLEHWESAH